MSVSRWEREDGLIRTLINVGELGPAEERFPAEETYLVSEYPLVARMLSTRQSYFNSLDDPDCAWAVRRVLAELEKASDVGVAIVVEGDVWGELWATRRTGETPFGADAARFLEQIAAQCAVAIGRAEQFSHVSRLAYEDPLTGLPNRRSLETRLDGAFNRFCADRTATTILLCDLDGLKEINDSMGHHAGDAVLRAVADALREVTAGHPDWFAARLAGDEFCVVLAGDRIEAATTLWTALGDRLSSSLDSPVALSGGASQADEGASSSADLLRAADGALYVAKRAGGGRLYLATEQSKPLRPSRARPSAQSIIELSERLADDLDGDLLGAPAIDRLESVARGFLDVGDFLTWTISIVRGGTRSLVDVSRGDAEFPTIRIGVGADEYPLGEFPLTAAAVDAGSGHFTVRRSDEAADERERMLLDRFGREWVIGVAASHGDDVYLLELYGGETTVPIESVLLPLRLLVRAAMPPR